MSLGLGGGRADRGGGVAAEQGELIGDDVAGIAWIYEPTFNLPLRARQRAARTCRSTPDQKIE
jgi:hypothetical protein